MSASSPQIPPTMKAWVLERPGGGVVLKRVPSPEVQPGAVVAKVLKVFMYPARVDILKASDTIPHFTYPYPHVPGNSAVVRVVATGPDTTAFSVGQLAVVDIFVRARDDPNNVQILWGVFDGPTPASKKFTADNWRNGLLAEYVRAPLENIHPVDEARLCGSPADGGLGYSIPELVLLPAFAVVYAGFERINLKAGETIVVSPATGHYSMAAVALASAIGANVVAVSRNAERLQKLQQLFPRVKTLQPTGDVDQDTAAIKTLANGPVDVFADVSSPAMYGTTHIASCMAAVKPYGRILLMGGRADPALPISYAHAVFNNLTIHASYMYEQEDVRGLIRLVESGVLRIGSGGGFPVVAEFPLESPEEAFNKVKSDLGLGGTVVISP
ncbi:hypothetical protein VTK56DRAFT_10145 [Thermocarpiscus australiensis]